MKIKTLFCLAVALKLVWKDACYGLDTQNQGILSPDTQFPEEDTSVDNTQQEVEALEQLKDSELQEMKEKKKLKEDEENTQPTTEIQRAPYALSFTFRNHKQNHPLAFRFSEIKDNQFNYLLISDTQKYCEGSSILLATNSPKLGITSLQSAEQMCNTSSECTFFSFAGAETKNYESPGTTWLCSGDDWLTAVPKSHWVTAIKPQYLQSLISSYVLHVNSAVICNDRNRLGEARGSTSPEAAAKTCDNDARCSYFSMYFGGTSSNPFGPRGQIVYYCTGPITNSTPAYGWIFASRLRLTKESTEINPETGLPFGTPLIVKPSISKSDQNERGPITQDNFYDSQDKGVVIPAVKMT